MSAKILQFVSRSEQLRLRGQRNYSRYMLLTKKFVEVTGQSVLSGIERRLRNRNVTPSGTVAMDLSRVARVFFSGDTMLKQHRKSRVGLLTSSKWASGRALTPMTVKQQRDGPSTPLPAADWELYRRLKAEGRLNLLFRFSEPAVVGLPMPETLTPRPNLLPFISRAEHLAWREQWRKGRWVKLSWTQKERDAILRQDELYRQADANWELNHGPIADRAKLLPFPKSPQLLSEVVVDTGSVIEG